MRYIYFLLLSICIALPACQQKSKPAPSAQPAQTTEQMGPAQQLGKQIDESVQRAHQQLQKITEPGGPIDKAGQQLQKTIQDTTKTINKQLKDNNQPQQSTTNP